MFTLIMHVLAWGTLGHAARVDCEHYLNGALTARAIRELIVDFTNRPFTYASSRELTSVGWQRLVGRPKDPGRNPSVSNRLVASLRFDEETLGVPRVPEAPNLVGAPWAFVVQEWDTDVLSPYVRIEFPDAEPLLWQSIPLRSKLPTHSQLVASAKLRTNVAFLTSEHDVGFVTDVHKDDGVRLYVRMRFDKTDALYNLEMGLDVPCRNLVTYITKAEVTRGEWRTVRTPLTEYCRIPGMLFTNYRFQSY